MNQVLPGDAVVCALQRGLPLVARPFAALAECASLGEERQFTDRTESALLAATREMVADGTISRFGVVVRHRRLGFTHNAMVVWDVVDARVDQVGETMAGFDFVTLCYRRPRRLPRWPYNLFCMVHGRERSTVRDQVLQLTAIEGLERAPHELLFSNRCFKQRGARYQPPAAGRTSDRLSTRLTLADGVDA